MRKICVLLLSLPMVCGVAGCIIGVDGDEEGHHYRHHHEDRRDYGDHRHHEGDRDRWEEGR